MLGMSKILAITGPTGPKSGSSFLRLVMEHIQVIQTMFPDGIKLLVRNPQKLDGIENRITTYQICVGNLEDEEYVKDALQDVDTLIHIAGINQSKTIVRAAAMSGVRRILVVHTTGIYSRYKKAGEEYREIDDFVYQTCNENNIIITILRPTMIYGNSQDNNVIKFIKAVDKLPIMPVVNGARYKLQPVHYEDLADAYYRVLVNENETANRDFVLSGGSEIELREMLTVIGKNLGKTVKFISIPFKMAYLGACVLYYLTFKNLDYCEKVQRLCEPRVYSHDEATKAFGYHPRTFEEGVREEVKAYLSKGKGSEG